MLDFQLTSAPLADTRKHAFGWPTPTPDAPLPIIYISGGIELVGGLLVAVGFFTTWAAFLCSGLMAAAYWMVHGSKGLIPATNGGELAVLYCFIFLYIASKGAGKWSVDEARG